MLIQLLLAALACPDGMVPGADVMVDFGEGDIETHFVPGSTLDEVQSQAENWFEEYEFEIVSSLYCNQGPS